MPDESTEIKANNDNKKIEMALPDDQEIVDIQLKGRGGTKVTRQGNVYQVEFGKNAPAEQKNNSAAGKTTAPKNTTTPTPVQPIATEKNIDQEDQDVADTDEPTEEVEEDEPIIPPKPIAEQPKPQTKDKPTNTPKPAQPAATPSLPTQSQNKARPASPPTEQSNTPASARPNTDANSLQSLRDAHENKLAKGEDADEATNAPEEENEEGRQAPGQLPGQNPPPSQPLSPADQNKAGQEIKKENAMKRLGNAGRAAMNMPGNAIKRAQNIGKKAKNLAAGTKAALKNPKQFAKNAAKKIGKKIGTAAANKIKNELQSVKFKKFRLARDIKKLEEEIKKLMEKLGKKYNDLKGSLIMWIFSILFPALHDRIRGVFNFATNANLKIMVSQLGPKVAMIQALKAILQGANLAFAVLDAIIITYQIVAATFYIGITFLLSPIIFLVAFIIFVIFKCGRFTKIIGDILKEISENLKPLEEKLNTAKEALAKQKQLTALTQEYSQAKLLEMERKAPENPEGDGKENESQTSNTEKPNEENNQETATPEQEPAPAQETNDSQETATPEQEPEEAEPEQQAA